MTNIIHLSDMHFGTEDFANIDILKNAVNQIPADVIIITGDFTQRARSNQFAEARNFINSLKCRKILCVPGNHDIPLHNLFSRFLFSFTKYKKFIAKNFNPTYTDETLAMIGLNSATPYTVMDGHVSVKQLKLAQAFFAQHKETPVKAVFMHHNMIQPELHKVLINLEEVLEYLAASGVQLVLSGHLHDAYIEKIERAFIKYDMYVITAGTALSKRLRTQPQSFNVMDISQNELKISVHALADDAYIAGEKIQLLV